MYSKASRKTVSGDTPDWDNLSDEDTEYYINEYNVRFNILKKNNSRFNIEKPDTSSLSALVHAYECSVKMISTHMCTANWKVVLGLMYYGLEVVMVNLFKFTMFNGYGKFQNDKMKYYEQSMIELGEMYASKEDENASPLWAIAKMSLTQSLIFILAGFVSKWITGINKNTVLGLFDGFYSPNDVKYSEDGVAQPPNSNDATDASGLLNMAGMATGGIGNVFGSLFNGKPKDKVASNFAKGADPVKKTENKPETTRGPYRRKRESV